MKMIPFKLPNLGASMLRELKAKDRLFSDLDAWLLAQVRRAYARYLRK